MEDISTEMQVSESKQASLCKAYETPFSGANSILEISFQWKELENHFNLTRSSLEAKLFDVSEREKIVAARETELASEDSALSLEVHSKSQRLAIIEATIETRTKTLGEVEGLIEASNRVICEKRRDIEALEQWMTEKERDCEELKEDIIERTKIIEFLEKCLRQKNVESESSKKELNLVRDMLSKSREELDFSRVSLCGYEDQLRALRNSVQEMDGDIRVRGEVLCSIQESIGKCSLELESKQTLLDSLRREFEYKKRLFVSLKKSVDGLDCKLDSRERQFEGLVQRIREANHDSYRPEFEELYLIHTKVIDSLEEVEDREKSLVSFQKSLEERSAELDKREREFKQRFDEFVLREKELDSIKSSTEFEVKIEQSENNHKAANLPSLASYPQFISNGQMLQSLITDQLKRNAARWNEYFDVLQGSKDPAMLVLEAVQGFYPLHPEGVDLSAVRSSCILLLEKLAAMSPKISPQVREKAKDLAFVWKAKMTESLESPLQLSGFLHLLVSYKLRTEFSEDEIHHFVELDRKIGQVESPFEVSLCLADEVSNETPDNTDQAENVTDVILSTSQNFKGNHLTQDDILMALQQLDPAKHVLGMVKDSLSQLWTMGDHVGTDYIFLKSYIFIFEQLIIRNCPGVEMDVREDALKLAKDWEERMRIGNIENSLEALGFLFFLGAYGLVWSFNEDYLASLLEITSRDRLVLEQSQKLGLAYKIEVYVQKLIEKKKHVVAVRLAFAFKLTNKFTPAKLLSEFIEDAKARSRQNSQVKKTPEEKDKAMDLEIDILAAVTQCVKEHNLETEYPLDNVVKRIALLKKIKIDRLHSAEFFRGTEEHQQQICNKRKISTTLIATNEQQQQKWKKKSPRKLTIG